jgi:nucleotide-binding universal stress UspA family protein
MKERMIGMLSIKKILCPTDFSERSYRALEIAGEFTQHFAAELVVAHVVTPVPTVSVPIHPAAFDVASYQKHLHEESQKVLDGLSGKYLPGNLQSRTVLAEGKPAEEINRIADEESVDLIILSTHGHSAIGQLLFGSVADRVVRHASKPVLTIRVPDEK